ncbi:hypothetical protein VTI74DRAFT_6820 [Chaetomium olivicolor]
MGAQLWERSCGNAASSPRRSSRRSGHAHSLQNYGKDEPVDDGKAYNISSIYHAAQLKLYAHHVTMPATPGGRLEHHMTLFDNYAMTGNRERVVKGAAAFRNTNALARRLRNELIKAASIRRARQSNAQPPLEAEIATAEAEEPDDSSSQEVVDYADYAGSQDIGNENDAIYSPGRHEGPSLPQSLHAQNRESSQVSTSLDAAAWPRTSQPASR